MLLAIVGSMLISIWANIVDDVVNNDGIEYIKSAQNFLDGRWSEAVQTFKWPFYAALMAIVSKVTFLELEIAAHLIDAIAFVWLTIAFLAVVGLLGGRRGELGFALLIILALPVLNKIRPYLIRDPAFLALFMTGCYYYFAYFLQQKKQQKKQQNMLAVGFFALSALFRIEGLIFLVMSQIYLIAAATGRKSAPWLAMGLTLVLMIIMLVLLSWWNFVPDGKLTYMSIFNEPLHFLETVWLQLIEQLDKRIHAIQTKVLAGYSRSYAMAVLLWSAATIVFFELMHALYYIYFGLFVVAVGRRGNVFPQTTLMKPWRFLLGVALSILFAFVIVQWFLSDRYPLAAAVLMLLPVPFLLAKWMRSTKLGAASKKSKVAYLVVVSLICLAGLKSLDLGTKKHYLKSAGKWLAHNTAADATVFTNNRIVAHYYGGDAEISEYWYDWRNYKISALIARENFDYLVFNVKPQNAEYAVNVPILVRREPVRIFENEKGAQVLIIEVNRKRSANGEQIDDTQDVRTIVD